MSYKFAARYPGRCTTCARPIEVDDDLVMEDEQAVHFECAGGPGSTVLRPREVCPRCFTEKAVNGSCACEEES